MIVYYSRLEGMSVQRGRTRRFFFGGNTVRGFVPHHHHLVGPHAARTFILKGGPGVGKSMFIKAVASELVERGEDVELYHCSSDPASLDGAWFPGSKIAILDGTPPHSIDPRFPGTVEEIVNLGDHWDAGMLTNSRPRIVDLVTTGGEAFGLAYRNLAICGEAWRLLADIYRRCTDDSLLERQAREFRTQLSEHGRLSNRRLAASAITPDGARGFVDDLLDLTPAACVVTGPVASTAPLLDRVSALAQAAGLGLEMFVCGLWPDRIDHIRADGFGLFSASPPHLAVDTVGAVDVRKWMRGKVLAGYADQIAAAERVYQSAFDSAVTLLGHARALHKRLEAIYIPVMDFAAVDRCRNRIFKRILRIPRWDDCGFDN